MPNTARDSSFTGGLEEGLRNMGTSRVGYIALLLFMYRLEKLFHKNGQTVVWFKSMVGENGAVNLTEDFRKKISEEAEHTKIPLPELTKLYKLAIRELVEEHWPSQS